MTPAHVNPLVSRESIVARRPLGCYFALTFAISWLGACALVAPNIVRREPVPKFAGLMMFPIMLLGPSLAGILMTLKLDGRRGLRDLFARITLVVVPRAWYAALLIPPALILLVLLVLRIFVSPVFSPNRFFMGASFGMVADCSRRSAGWDSPSPECLDNQAPWPRVSGWELCGRCGICQSSIISAPQLRMAPTGFAISSHLPSP